jgi:hypothetical protein
VRRRRFLGSLGAVALLPGLESVLGPLARADTPPSPFAGFEPVESSDADELLLPHGFRYDIVLKWGDPFTRAGEPFGFNNDFIGVFQGERADEALLVVNHEYISNAFGGDAALYDDTFRVLRGRAPTVDDYKLDVGLSVLRVRRGGDGAWAAVVGDPLNRRVNARTPCLVDGPAAAILGGGGAVEGTLANCGGQVTPWGTALSCEENYQDVVPDLVDAEGRSVPGGVFGLPGADYGWVVEVDPFDPGSAPIKHTALGRFRHENVGLRCQPGRRAAAYMGDDRTGGHVWKYLSHEDYDPRDRARSRRLLSSGRLFVARFERDGKGEWVPLDVGTRLRPNTDPKDPKPFLPRWARRLSDCYASQGVVLMDAYQAANAVGGSACGRPEDLEIHPVDGSVFIAFTAASARPGPWDNPYGEVWRLVERHGDVRAREFTWSRFAVGGPAGPEGPGRVFAQPDNLLFDRRGDLWMTTDISSHLINAREDYLVFRNSGLFHVPVSGPQRGRPRQFASMPCEAEPTGPNWAPNEEALFLSVQHPGERYGIRREGMPASRGSNWPHGTPGAPPQPAVVAIRRA